MNFILDTHSFLWFIAGDERLSSRARLFISDTANSPFLSIASLWEMAIKLSIGKLKLAQPIEVMIPYQMEINGIRLLDIKLEHVVIVATLPYHHRDPFDRLLIAQAMAEQMPIVTRDTQFGAYNIEQWW